jgi:predicted nuclease of predicted toxin-antitoxin system
MKFKLDEHLPAELADDLRRAGHDAVTVVDQGLSGTNDQVLMRVVQAESRVMLTMDKGIANVNAYPPGSYAGIVLFRPHQTGRGAVLQFVRQHMPAVLKLITAGALIVVSDRGIRVR